MTVFIQIVPEGAKYDPDGWTPWKNCKDADDAVHLAVHKFLRESGYTNPRNEHRKPITLNVYHFPDSTPRYRNHRPTRCQCYTMKVTPNS